MILSLKQILSLDNENIFASLISFCYDMLKYPTNKYHEVALKLKAQGVFSVLLICGDLKFNKNNIYILHVNSESYIFVKKYAVDCQ